MKECYKLYLDIQVINKFSRGEKVLISDYFKFDKKTYKYVGDTKFYKNSKDVIAKFSKELTNSSIDSNYFTNNVNLLYRFPKLSLSRDKLSLYQEKTNFKISRDKEKSDLCVVSNSFLESQLQQEWSTQIEDKILMLNFLQKSLEMQPDDHQLINYINWIDSMSDDVVFLTKKSYGWRDDKVTGPIVDFLYNVHDKLVDGQSTYVYYFNDPETYNWLNNNKHKLIMDTELNKLCTEDSVELTFKDWDSLVGLINSTDTDNTSVCMTLMSNCNTSKSKTVLSLLFTYFSEKMKHSKLWTQVNFKALKKDFTKYIDLYPNNYGHSYNAVIDYLAKDNALEDWAVKYVAKKLFKNVLDDNFGVGGVNFAFKIDENSLLLNDKYKDKLVNSTQEEVLEININPYGVLVG
tara:strand:+ start:2264 stop:3478 length:1215 start_codon:yes stop_codon:yes gene_type:complete